MTDINAALGKLDPRFFPAIFGPDQTEPLDVPASRRGFAELARTIGDGRSIEEVAEGFLDIARRERNRCVIVDATPDADTVAEAIWRAAAERLSLG